MSSPNSRAARYRRELKSLNAPSPLSSVRQSPRLLSKHQSHIDNRHQPRVTINSSSKTKQYYGNKDINNRGDSLTRRLFSGTTINKQPAIYPSLPLPPSADIKKARSAANAIKLRAKLQQEKQARAKTTQTSMSSKNKKQRPPADDDTSPNSDSHSSDDKDRNDDDDSNYHPSPNHSDDNVNNSEDEHHEQPKKRSKSSAPVYDVNDSVNDFAMRNRHREVFFDRAFRDEDSPNSSACRPQAEVDNIIFILEHWEVGKKISSLIQDIEKYRVVKAFRESHKVGYKHEEKYFVEYITLPDGFERAVLRRKEPSRPHGGRIVVSREQVFDAIDEWHRHCGHMGQERTHSYCRDKYYNCTQTLVRIYCETCFVCRSKNPTVKPMKGSRKPIRSNGYRDRFQVDLIDFRKMRKRDPFGVLMKWVVTVKDHATGFTHISAIPSKTAHNVAHRLQEVFGLIGYPSIFHTDNGKEFTAREILQYLRRVNPNILSVTGRPRKPSDQGSVERMNRLVKRLIGSELSQRRLAGENPNWTEVLGAVMATINSQKGRSSYAASSYMSIFGQKYDQDFSCSKEEARLCWSVKDRLLVSKKNSLLHLFFERIICFI